MFDLEPNMLYGIVWVWPLSSTRALLVTMEASPLSVVDEGSAEIWSELKEKAISQLSSGPSHQGREEEWGL